VLAQRLECLDEVTQQVDGRLGLRLFAQQILHLCKVPFAHLLDKLQERREALVEMDPPLKVHPPSPLELRSHFSCHSRDLAAQGDEEACVTLQLREEKLLDPAVALGEEFVGEVESRQVQPS